MNCMYIHISTIIPQSYILLQYASKDILRQFPFCPAAWIKQSRDAYLKPWPLKLSGVYIYFENEKVLIEPTQRFATGTHWATAHEIQW